MNKQKQIYNPFLPLTEYIPDGEPHVFGDRVYLFGSHYRAGGDHYCMNDYVAYSAMTTNLKEWKYEGIIYRKNQDPRNADGSHCLWAPDVVRGSDGRYYLYYCLDTLPELGVAVCDTPTGEYRYLDLVRYKDGTPLGTRPTDYVQFDPAVLVDDDGEVYLFSGNGPKHIKESYPPKYSQIIVLEQDMITVKREPEKFLPILHEGVGTEFEGHEFFEASSIRKIKDTYYFVYSDIVTHSLCYATSRFPDHGYHYRGAIVALGDIGLKGRTKAQALNYLGNIHGGIERINNEWYVFYHRQTNQTQFSRQACAEKIEINKNGTIKQVEMTSCGLNGQPLTADGVYPAAIACNLMSQHGCCFSDLVVMAGQHPYITQEGEDDQEGAYVYIKNIQKGTMLGYKYFAFQGETALSIWVRGKGEGVFYIRNQKNGKNLVAVPVKADTEQWMKINARVNFLKGKYPLYIQYQGKGILDVREFEFVNESR